MELTIIQSKIYEIRGLRVILDFDLSEMYQVETRRLNESVKRNIKRFPPDFMFQLTKHEWEILMSQIATSKRGGTRKLPYAFTEQGVAMLSGLLNSNVAIDVNIGIMRAFAAMRQLILNNPTVEVKEVKNEISELKKYIEEVFADYNDINEDTRMQMELITETLAELQNKKKALSDRKQIGFSAPQYGNDESSQ
jgi:ORF6N domain.